MEKSWNRFNPKPPLDPDFLWPKGSKDFSAEDETACRDAGEVADFRERLGRLCRSLQSEAQLNSLGHAMAYGQLKAAVRTRHRLGRMWRERPELPATPIAAPIVVVGQMRSGTTRLHRLLAADPAHSGTRLCNSIEPVPRRPDIRPIRVAAGLALARKINPWVDTLHPFGATRPDEELGWLGAALNHDIYEAQYRIPSFVAFSEARDPAPVYRELARILRSDAAVMGDAMRPRVLKCPQYAEDLPALLAQFPDARVVVTRRNPDEVLASTVSVVASQMAYQSDHVSLEEIEREWRRKLALREARMEAALASYRGPLAEVEFAALGADWEGEVRRIYHALGLDLSPSALAAMQAERSSSAREGHVRHQSDYRAFGSA